MAIRPPRRTGTRQTTPSSPTVRDTSPAGVTTPKTVAATGSSAVDAQKKAVLDTFEASLRQQPGLEGDELEFVIAHMRKRVQEMEFQPEIAGPDRNAWVQTLDALVEGDLLSRDECDVLIRQFGEATGPLHTRDAMLALELARRIERDGHERAMEWLVTQETGDAGGILVSSLVEVTGKQSITRSRSRRLRGPPARA